MTTQTASPPCLTAISTPAEHHDQRQGAGLIPGPVAPSWAWELAVQLNGAQARAALTAAGQLPPWREATFEQIRTLIATGLARLGYAATRDLDDRLRSLNLLWISTDSPAGRAARRAYLRIWDGARRAENATDLVWVFMHYLHSSDLPVGPGIACRHPNAPTEWPANSPT